MVHESNGRDWSKVLGALPFPAAILDAGYRFVLVNQACAADPLLARSRIGETDLACCGGEPETLARARQRHRHYARSLRSQEPLTFEEDASGGQKSPCLWICLPIRKADQTWLAVVCLGADLAGVGEAKPEALGQLMNKINQELRPPLAALVGLAGVLTRELSGEQQARASLIDQSGQHLLRQLSHLVDAANNSLET